MLSLDEALYSIILLFATIDEDGMVWGHDADMGSVEDYKDDIKQILGNIDREVEVVVTTASASNELHGVKF